MTDLPTRIEQLTGPDREVDAHLAALQARPDSALAMTAFADQLPERDELWGEQTFLTDSAHTDTWDVETLEAGWDDDLSGLPIGRTHWLDISLLGPRLPLTALRGNDVLEEAAKVILALLFRESERSSNEGDCACSNLSPKADREYEGYRCPHQNARKWLNRHGFLESEYPQAIRNLGSKP